ncbi:hypothetical protein B5A14_004261 [Salmonella enterica subsp. enterica serovar Luciana]|uniref:Uncharacterized protein n=1 Tax=Salmonella enterica TaxID=28901 RepID=A0A749QEK0_SALER|nr:hypothetical protein [Salmonella enterica]EDX3293466.1 hypothetical protein [Salmonella enterica subsp. enterica serovar Luciana]EEE4212305.1 hypothetical protein [Salmonella enterica subsp. enterica serovar Muenchen]EAQ7631451.1 hypothetical protein [Salmonella enterica]EAQ9149703.1 hypothetical protein [Salmonella enterica]EAS4274834.1 hypothetical protein [Salmonella enterica]
MGNVIEFKRPKGERNQKDKMPKRGILLWFKKTALSLKNNLFTYSKSCCCICLFFVSAASRKLLKLIATLSIVLFLVEWFMGRLGAPEFYNLLFLMGLLLVINVISTSCIKWIRGNA